MTQPTFWIQSFDDPLFPIDQAVLMHRLQASPDNKLYLSWGGHFAPAQPDYEAKFREAQIYRWMQRWLQNDHNGIDTEPPVTWWSLAPNRHDIIPHASPTWPPPGLDMVPVDLVPGQAANLFGAQGTHDDPTIHFLGNTAGQGSVVQNLPAQTPIDTMITSTDPLAQDVTYAGSAHADIQWQSSGSPTQVDVKVWDIAPDGSATLLARGCTMAGGGPTGAATAAAFTGGVQLDLWHDAVEIPAGHRFQVWVQPADFPLWQPPAPAVVTMGQGSRVTLPLLASAPGSSLFQGHASHGPTTRLTLPNTSARAGDASGPGSIRQTPWLTVTAGLLLMVPAALWTLARRRRG